jgi:hypothetical protein
MVLPEAVPITFATRPAYDKGRRRPVHTYDMPAAAAGQAGTMLAFAIGFVHFKSSGLTWAERSHEPRQPRIGRWPGGRL